MPESVEENTEQQAAIFRALGDPTRLKLVKLLCRQSAPGALCVNALASQLHITQSAVSQHLRALKSMGLVKGEKKGYYVHYHINHEALERCRELVAAILTIDKSDSDEQSGNIHCHIRERENVKMTDKPLLPQEILNNLQTDESGSVVLHIGVVRPSSEGKRVVSIEYQADRSEGEQELSLITAEVQAGWEIQDIVLCRRVGKLNLGEVIMVAAVAAPHHEQAFEACKQAVERTRTMASVKKKEVLEERN